MSVPTPAPAVASLGDAVSTLPAAMYPRKLERISLTGARGSRAEIYLGNRSASSRFDQTSRGASNTAEYANPVDIPAGSVVFVVWPGQSAYATASTATFTTDR